MSVTSENNLVPLGAAQAPAKQTLIGLTREQLGNELASLGVPEKQARMRASQIWHWLYIRGAVDFDEMLNPVSYTHLTLPTILLV